MTYKHVYIIINFLLTHFVIISCYMYFLLARANLTEPRAVDNYVFQLG
jgi:hypothetical protein